MRQNFVRMLRGVPCVAVIVGVTGFLHEVQIRMPEMEAVGESSLIRVVEAVRELPDAAVVEESLPAETFLGGVPRLYGGITQQMQSTIDITSQYMASLERRQIVLSEESYLSPKKQKKKKKKNKKKEAYRTYLLPEYESYHGFKTYEPYRAITSTGSPQYKLQQDARTDENGIRVVDKRYCVAIGSYFGVEIGQYFDLLLENGTVIPCIKGDEKSDRHTDRKYHVYTVHSGCCSEFLVDTAHLKRSVARSGDVSKLCEEWDSPVAEVHVYEKSHWD